MTDYQKLAEKYFRGEINDQEEKTLYDWVKADEDHLNALHAWEEAWRHEAEGDASEMWTRMLGRLSAREVLETEDVIPERKQAPWWSLAAAVAALLSSLFFLFRPVEPQLYTMEAPAGERCRVFLPDSSVVWLNSGSRLCFNDDFNTRKREVKLIGEGYFEVAHRENRPFSVTCGDVSVLVRGTRFNVSAYPEERYVQTSVVDGHVTFIHGEAHVDLYKGQSARFDLVSETFYRSMEDPEDAAAWTNSQFVYSGISLTELAEKLSRTYAVKFHFNTTEHLNDVFSIALRNNETLPEVLSALERIIPIKTRMEGNNVYVDKK